MKKLFIICSLIFSQFLKAQHPVVTLGPELDWDSWNGQPLSRLMGNSSNLFYAFSGNFIFDFHQWRVNNLVAKKDSVIKIKMPEVDKKEVWCSGLLCMNNQLLMFGRHFNKVKKTYQLSAFKFNSDLSLNKIPVVIDHAKELLGLRMEVQENGKILITYSESDNKEEKVKFNVLLLNADASLVWKKDIELPYVNEECEVHNLKVLKNGKLYFLARINKKKEEIVNDKADMLFKLFEYDPANNSGKEIILNPDDAYVVDIKLFFNKEDKLVCAGTFAREKPSYNMKGLYTVYGRLMKGFFYCPLNSDFTQSEMEVKNLEIPKDQSEGAHLTNIVEMKNGTLMYLVEQKFKGNHAFGFMIINYDPVLKQYWFKRREWTKDPVAAPNIIFSMNTDQKVCMVYSDRTYEDNVNQKKDGKHHFWYTLSQDGIEQEGPLLSEVDNKYPIKIQMNIRVSNNEYVSCMETKRGMRFVKINFE